MVHAHYVAGPDLQGKYQLQWFSSRHIERVCPQKNAGFADIACRTADSRVPWLRNVNIYVDGFAFRCSAFHDVYPAYPALSESMASMKKTNARAMDMVVRCAFINHLLYILL